MLFEVFRAHEVMVYEAAVNVARLSVMFAATWAVIRMGYGLPAILWVMLVCVTLALLAAVAIYRKRFSGGSRRFERKTVSDFLRMAFVFGLGSGLYTLYSKIDVVMLERMVGQESVGVYAAAYTLLENLEVISIVFTASFMPYIIRTLVTSKEQAFGDSRRSMSYLLLIGLPTALLFTVFAGPVVSLLYGTAYGKSAAVLNVIIWAVPVKYAFAILSIYLIANDREVTGLYSGVLGVVLNVLLNLFLIPRFAQMGAAVATVVTESVMLVLQFVFVLVFAGRALLPDRTGKLCIANLALAVFVLFARGAGTPLTVLLGVLLYGVILFTMGFFRTEERDFVREVFRASGGGSGGA
jgi:O-antigen/teichoic acid export membrane protein